MALNRTSSPNVIVVGAGISGLTAGLRLQQRGFTVTVLERDQHVGGRMVCTRRDGFTINRASGILPASYGQIRALIDELGLEDHVATIRPEMSIPFGGGTHRLRTAGPGLIADGIRTRLISTRSKAVIGRLALDAYRARHALSYEDASLGVAFDHETAAEYCERRLNPEIRDAVIRPIVRAMFLEEAEHVSVVDLFFMVARILGRPQLRYHGGIDFVCRALADRLDVRTGSHVTSVQRDQDEVVVHWRDREGEHADRVGGCVLAVPGPELCSIHPGIDPVQRDILEHHVQFACTIVGHFALGQRPPETALLTAVPADEHADLSLLAFHHVVAPDCAPPGKGLVSGYWMHEWSKPRMTHDEAALRAEMMPAMEQLMPGISATIEFSYIDRWHPLVMHCPQGIYQHLATFRARIDPEDRIQLAGDYFGYGSTNRCSITGEQAANRLTDAIGSATTLGSRSSSPFHRQTSAEATSAP